MSLYGRCRAVAAEVVITDRARLAPIITMGVIVDAARMETDEPVETVRVRDRLGCLSQVPLAKNPGRVPRRLQQRCDRLLARPHRLPLPRNARATLRPPRQ